MKNTISILHHDSVDRLSRILRTAGRFTAIALGALAISAIGGCAGARGNRASDSSAGVQSSAPADASGTSDVSGVPASSNHPGENHRVSVFAASSLTQVMTELEAAYEAGHAEIDLIFTFDSSGTLKTQIEEGAECDLFLSASPAPVDTLLSADPCPVLKREKTDLLTNSLVLAASPDYDGPVAGFSDLTPENLTLLAIGNEDVPAGAYAKELLDNLGLYRELSSASCLSLGSNVREVTIQTAGGAVDCGIVFATDAASEGLLVLETADPALYSPIVYPAAVITTGEEAEAAQDFLSWLQTQEAESVFRSAGFGTISP